MRSGMVRTSMVSTGLYSHSFLKIFPMFARSFPYTTFPAVLRYQHDVILALPFHVIDFARLFGLTFFDFYVVGVTRFHYIKGDLFSNLKPN